jgi:hypothetical protein
MYNKRLTSISCSGTTRSMTCYARPRVDRWYPGSFQAGLPVVNAGDCVSLGWELLLDGTYRLRVDTREGCINKFELGADYLRYSDEMGGVCPPKKPTRGEVYRCLDRFGAALIKTGIQGLYNQGWSEKCQGPFQSVAPVASCSEDTYENLTIQWGDISTPFGAAMNCASSYMDDICGNSWVVVDTYYSPGARPRFKDVVPQGPCVGPEDDVVAITRADPSNCGGFNPCGLVTTYSCQSSCAILTDDDDTLITEGGDRIIWCTTTNESGFTFTVARSPINYEGMDHDGFALPNNYAKITYTVNGNIILDRQIVEIPSTIYEGITWPQV